MIGDLAEPGVCPVRFHTKWPMASVALFGQAKSPVKLEGKKPSADAQPSGEAVAKVEDGRLDGPLVCKGSGKLSVNGEAKLANTAYRLSLQRAENRELRTISREVRLMKPQPSTLRLISHSGMTSHSCAICFVFRGRKTPPSDRES